jgi:hypothetical protein
MVFVIDNIFHDVRFMRTFGLNRSFWKPIGFACIFNFGLVGTIPIVLDITILYILTS